MKWQPIETAPADEDILAAWDAPTPEFKAIGVVRYVAKIGWLARPGDYVKHPTHWMHLPEPPK